MLKGLGSGLGCRLERGGPAKETCRVQGEGEGEGDGGYLYHDTPTVLG